MVFLTDTFVPSQSSEYWAVCDHSEFNDYAQMSELNAERKSFQGLLSFSTI